MCKFVGFVPTLYLTHEVAVQLFIMTSSINLSACCCCLLEYDTVLWNAPLNVAILDMVVRVLNVSRNVTLDDVVATMVAMAYF